MLRQAREAAGVDLASLAVALKVSVKKLEALESDRLDLLPDAVFVRALASSVCRALKIDAGPGAGPAAADRRAAAAVDDETGLNTPFHTPGDVAKTPFWDRLSRPMVLAALTVLIGALVLIFFPSIEQRAEIGAIVATRTGAGSGDRNRLVPAVVPAPRRRASPARPRRPRCRRSLCRSRPRGPRRQQQPRRRPLPFGRGRRRKPRPQCARSCRPPASSCSRPAARPGSK